jgi:exodeoxyribonuclease V alpha subunit
MAARNNEERHLQRGFFKVFIGDRVIQTENNYKKMVFNGDMGTVIELGEKVVDAEVNDKKQKFITVKFYNNTVTYFDEEIDDLYLAWCCTVHKYQGSQSKDLVFTMSSEAQIMMNKELVYTAITRGARRVDIFGSKNMWSLAPSRSSIRKRNTNLINIVKEIRENRSLLVSLGD